MSRLCFVSWSRRTLPTRQYKRAHAARVHYLERLSLIRKRMQLVAYGKSKFLDYSGKLFRCQQWIFLASRAGTHQFARAEDQRRRSGIVYPHYQAGKPGRIVFGIPSPYVDIHEPQFCLQIDCGNYIPCKNNNIFVSKLDIYIYCAFKIIFFAQCKRVI